LRKIASERDPDGSTLVPHPEVLVRNRGTRPDPRELYDIYFATALPRNDEIATERVRITPYKKKELEAMVELVNQGEAVMTIPDRSLTDFGRCCTKDGKSSDR
jgi:hypothetical protein